jgi:hypothetical protein
MQINYNMMIITKDGVGILKDLEILWIKMQMQMKCNAVVASCRKQAFWIC